jgi:hypothetical protein
MPKNHLTPHAPSPFSAKPAENSEGVPWAAVVLEPSPPQQASPSLFSPAFGDNGEGERGDEVV